ncbi:MAG: ORF6N domain-containing protein, partial [Oscillospiraceae bacterium]|nr:ORF6N domain-containing protein [Oscillospiraceae bacterium]
MSEETKGLVPEDNDAIQLSSIVERPFDIKSLIYIVQNQQVMLDSDLAALYQVETKRLNEAVRRNISRFPEKFCFQLTSDEFEGLRSQFATSNRNDENDSKRGGRRTMPYVFTEQGIAMLSAVLRSDTAIQVSIRIMETFVEMRRFIASNSLLFEHITNVELKLLEYAKNTDTKLDELFEYINDHKESNQKV